LNCFIISANYMRLIFNRLCMQHQLIEHSNRDISKHNKFYHMEGIRNPVVNE
jgi:hypothetical protein